jgi:trimeric autotransporter adhesin
VEDPRRESLRIITDKQKHHIENRTRKENYIMKTPSMIIRTILLAFGFLALAPQAQAVCQDACFANENTAHGEDALFNNSGLRNTALGFRALLNNTTGESNTATGKKALLNNTTGGFNTATGSEALFNNNTGQLNTATGAVALWNNRDGDENTATGVNALTANVSGNRNTATGYLALHFNEVGNDNTANGVGALFDNSGNQNTAIGVEALQINRRGSNNTASGAFALHFNTGEFNTASGAFALQSNEGDFNTASGGNALLLNTEGNSNVAEGFQALYNNMTGNENTGIGLNALFSNTTGSRNTALGTGAGGALTTGSDNIVIGNSGIAGDSATIRIGTQGTQTNTFVAGIFGSPIGFGAVAVRVNSNGKLGTFGSSARFKQNIKAMDKASEAIYALKPVTFRYKQEIDPEGVSQFGLVAEDVAKVNPDLVVRDAHGKLYSVHYDAVNAMLLNEFLKEHRKVEELEATVAQQQKDFQSKLAEQEKQMAALASGLQKVSAQIETSRTASQIVKNDY